MGTQSLRSKGPRLYDSGTAVNSVLPPDCVGAGVTAIKEGLVMFNDSNAVNPRVCAARTWQIHAISAPAKAGRSGVFHRVKTNSGTTGQQQLRKQLLVVIGVLLCICARK